MPRWLDARGWRLAVVPLAATLLLAVVTLAAATTLGRSTLAGQAFNLAAGSVIFGGWWVWRGIVRRARWPLSGLELVFAAAGALALLSLAASPDQRVSAGRCSELALLVILFYFTLDCLRAGFDRHILTRGLLWVTGVLLVLALDEAYLHYTGLWEQTHSLSQTFAGPIFRVVGILGNVNYLAGIFNLALPLAIWEWHTTPGRVGRSLLLFWALCFVLVQPFMASRAGLLALGVVLALLAGGWFWERGGATLQGALGAFRRRGRWWLAGGALLLGIAAAWLVYLDSRRDILASRSDIWQAALIIIRTHPWLGVGIGRYGFESPRFLADTQVFWPIHAHSVPLTLMAECGLLGLPILIWGVGAVFREGWLGWRSTTGSQRLYFGLIGAALAGFAFHNLFDDLNQNAGMAICLVLMVALLLSARPERTSRRPLAWVGVPLAVLAAVNGLWVWGYSAFEAGRAAWSAGDKPAALAGIREAIRRDPQVGFYYSEAGMVAADMAADPNPSAGWPTAAAFFERALVSGENMALLHANVGLSNWWAGNRTLGQAEMETAAQLAPAAASLNLTAGWMAEQQNQPGEAESYYLAALRSQPGWQAHSFWSRSPVRSQSLAAYRSESTFEPDTASPAAQAKAALAGLRLADISRLLQTDAGQIDPWLVDVMLGDVALADGRDSEGMRSYSQALEVLTRPSVVQVGGTFWNGYGAGLYGRQILNVKTVPGLLTLDTTEAVEQRFEQLAAWTAQHGDRAAVLRIAQYRLWLNPDNQAARLQLAQP